jgi:uncharacterized protein (TIGR03382 family)
MRRLVIALVLLGAAPAALATPNFPGAIRANLGAVASPACAVCHAGGVTGRGTVTTPFGAAMRARGLVAYDETSLTAALAALTQDNVDSNGDGVADVDALKQGLDPNVGGSSGPVPEYGCVGSVAGGTHGAGVYAALAGVVLVALRRRRRARA